MELLVLIYLFLYISHIVYGPYYLHFLIENEEFKFKSKNLKEILQKSFYITYISLLFTIYFFYNPNAESFIIALLLTCLATIMYIIVYYDSEYFYTSMIDHVILLLPFIYYYYIFKIKLNTFKPSTLSLYTLVFLIIYYYNYNYLYH